MALNRDSWWMPHSVPRPPDELIEGAVEDTESSATGLLPSVAPSLHGRRKRNDEP